MTVNITMNAMRERAEQLKEKRPGYAAVLDLYVQVREAQDASLASVRVDPVKVTREWKELLVGEGFSLVAKEDLLVDSEAATGLFRTMCGLGRAANPHMAAEINKIDRALANNSLDLNELVVGGGSEQAIENASADTGLDTQVLSFLVLNSIKPSIEAGSEQLRGEVDLEAWRKVHCPVCGSLPALSLLQGEGARYFLCSHCACQWRVDRLSCSVCGSKEQGALQYFCGEGEGAHRIDLCDSCHHYIKTIDTRSLAGSDPVLEDIATMHLDVLAVKKGYTRAVPNPWTT